MANINVPEVVDLIIALKIALAEARYRTAWTQEQNDEFIELHVRARLWLTEHGALQLLEGAAVHKAPAESGA